MANNIFENLSDEEQKNLWIYMIFNVDKIKAKTEQWTKEAEKVGMTLTEYLESINPLNETEIKRSCNTCKHNSVADVGQYPCNECRRDILLKYEAKVITRGNCMMCGKELTEGLFFCKECESKAVQGRK